MANHERHRLGHIPSIHDRPYFEFRALKLPSFPQSDLKYDNSLSEKLVKIIELTKEFYSSFPLELSREPDRAPFVQIDCKKYSLRDYDLIASKEGTFTALLKFNDLINESCKESSSEYKSFVILAINQVAQDLLKEPLRALWDRRFSKIVEAAFANISDKTNLGFRLCLARNA